MMTQCHRKVTASGGDLMAFEIIFSVRQRFTLSSTFFNIHVSDLAYANDVPQSNKTCLKQLTPTP